ncbi:MAG TPA: hypothetical protein VH397_00525 [Xanthobacteraceae bacterium]|jgi:hypothetical protein
MASIWRIAAIVLVAGTSAAAAAQLVPPSDQAGRERYRFAPSPLDRFLQPAPPAKPLLRWDCQPPGSWRAKPRSRRNPTC